MDEIKHVYRCSACNAQKEYKENESVPICCDKPMIVQTLPQCTTTTHPEMARNYDEDQPCDDGRGKQ